MSLPDLVNLLWST